MHLSRFLVIIAFLFSVTGTFAASSNSTPSKLELAYGDRGPKVTVVQKRLQSKGLLKKNIKAYGFSGNLTMTALKLEAKGQPKVAVAPKAKSFEIRATAASLKGPSPKKEVAHGKIWNFFFGAKQTAKYTISSGPRKIHEETGRATHFGLNDRFDNGVGHNMFNPHSVTEGMCTKYIKGVALPSKLLCKIFNLPPLIKKPTRSQLVAQWKMWQVAREAGVKVWAPGRQPEIVHIVDFLGNDGIAAIDETWYLNQSQCGDGIHSFEVIKGHFPSGHRPIAVASPAKVVSKSRIASR